MVKSELVLYFLSGNSQTLEAKQRHVMTQNLPKEMKVGSVTHHLLGFCVTCVRNVPISEESLWTLQMMGFSVTCPLLPVLFLVVVQSVAMWGLCDSTYCKVTPAEWDQCWPVGLSVG